MGLLFIDGFETYGNAAGAQSPADAFLRRWLTYGTAYPTLALHDSGFALRILEDTDARSRTLTEDATLVVGVAVNVVSASDGDLLFQLYDDDTPGVGVAWGTGGELKVVLDSTVLDATTGLGLTTGTWYYIELKVVCGDSGSYDLHVDEVSVLSDTAVGTKNGAHDYHNAVYFPSYAGNEKQIDHLYVLDGTTGRNDFLGVCKVSRLDPSADGGTNEWTPQSGTNHAAMVDDGAASDDDSTYVEDDASGHKELWDYGDLESAGEIFGVQIGTEVRTTDTQGFQIKALAKRTSETEGSNLLVLGSAYHHVLRVLEQDTEGSDWSLPNLNATQFGVKVV